MCTDTPAQACTHAYTREYYSALKKEDSPFGGLRGFEAQCTQSGAQRDMLYDLRLLCGPQRSLSQQLHGLQVPAVSTPLVLGKACRSHLGLPGTHGSEQWQPPWGVARDPACWKAFSQPFCSSRGFLSGCHSSLLGIVLSAFPAFSGPGWGSLASRESFCVLMDGCQT